MWLTGFLLRKMDEFEFDGKVLKCFIGRLNRIVGTTRRHYYNITGLGISSNCSGVIVCFATKYRSILRNAKLTKEKNLLLWDI